MKRRAGMTIMYKRRLRSLHAAQELSVRHFPFGVLRVKLPGT